MPYTLTYTFYSGLPLKLSANHNIEILWSLLHVFCNLKSTLYFVNTLGSQMRCNDFGMQKGATTALHVSFAVPLNSLT